MEQSRASKVAVLVLDKVAVGLLAIADFCDTVANACTTKARNLDGTELSEQRERRE